MSKTHLLSLITVFAVSVTGCAVPADGDDEAATARESLTLMHCPLPPGSASDAKKRLIGYIVADGVATSLAEYKYRLSVPTNALADHISALIAQAGVTGTTRSTTHFTFPIGQIGEYFVPAASDNSYPFDPPGYLADNVSIPAYASPPGCGLRHFLAAVLELDGAQGTGIKAQQVIDDPHDMKQAEFVAAWKAIGASTTHISGDSVLIDKSDNPIAQCLPNRNYTRVPGGPPAPGVCP
jgi:hypothetical protein